MDSFVDNCPIITIVIYFGWMFFLSIFKTRCISFSTNFRMSTTCLIKNLQILTSSSPKISLSWRNPINPMASQQIIHERNLVCDSSWWINCLSLNDAFSPARLKRKAPRHPEPTNQLFRLTFGALLFLAHERGTERIKISTEAK